MTDWRTILEEHGAKVWRTAYRLLNHHADALDCYQDTFLAAHQFARKQPVEDWAALLTSLAARRAIDRLRQRIRGRSAVTLDSVAEPGSDADCPVQRAEASELMGRIQHWMTELPDKQAEVFWLSCVEGLAHPQIALQMNITTNEVGVLLHRARSRLGALLGTHLADERHK
jgi:RNA polymerase sigma-70 factor (ECF subfamily)